MFGAAQERVHQFRATGLGVGPGVGVGGEIYSVDAVEDFGIVAGEHPAALAGVVGAHGTQVNTDRIDSSLLSPALKFHLLLPWRELGRS